MFFAQKIKVLRSLMEMTCVFPFFVQYHGHAKMTLFKVDWACAINDAVTTRPMFGLFSVEQESSMYLDWKSC